MNNMKKYSRDLRKYSTIPEKLLWIKLRRKNLGYKFYRQYVMGNFILDFYCFKKKLCIELDGDSHLNYSIKSKDILKEKFLNDLKIKVIRFYNYEVQNNIDAVLFQIIESLNSPNPS